MRKYKIEDNKYLIIYEDNKVIQVDLDKLFPQPFIEYKEKSKILNDN